MLGLLRRNIERFDLNKYPHEYPKDMELKIIDEHGHLNKYFDINKGYFTLYDLAVYIIVGTFMIVFLKEIIGKMDSNESAYMFVCVVIIGICALLY